MADGILTADELNTIVAVAKDVPVALEAIKAAVSAGGAH